MFVFVASKEKHTQEEVSKEVSKIIKHKKVVHKMELHIKKKQSQVERSSRYYHFNDC